ncbi:MAG: serine/threonine-protein kinase, partial [Rubrobacter sp.]
MPDHQKLLGRFTLERSLGSGGMSNVYLGRDEVLGRPIAVKLLRGGLYGDKGEDTAARFRREGRTAARLSHPNIVPVYDAGETLLARPETPDEEPVEVSYIVMEYVPSGDLGGLIEDHGPLERDELCRLGAGTADALSHAHGRGVIHRDVKPQNILLDPSGRPKLTDFGIARALEAPQVTRTGNYLGTALYSSPEQLLGEKVSGKTDVYALGITLYQAATGRPPFQGTMMEIAQEHLKTSPVPPYQRIPGMDRRLSEAIMSCLAKDPDDRPTAEGFSATLLGVTGGLRPENLASPHETGQDRPEEGSHPEEPVAAAIPPAAGSLAPAAPG